MNKVPQRIMSNILSNQNNIINSTIRKLSNSEFSTLKVTTPHEYVYHVQLNRPEKRNAMNPTFFDEIKKCFDELNLNPDCRSIVLSGSGKGFTAGLDLSDLSAILASDTDDVGRKAFTIRKTVERLQQSISAPENCQKPVIACIHGFCVGGGIDLITACDIRYCTKDAWFTVKEVDIGLAADIGTLQRFPKIVGNDSLIRELVYTARRFDASEAQTLGLVSRVFPDQESLVNSAIETAKLIASKSPIAVQSSKINLIYSRDHTVEEGLKFISAWNSSMLQSEDTMKAAMASLSKESPTFSKL